MVILGLCARKCPSCLKWFFDFDFLDLLRRFVQRTMRRRTSAGEEYSTSTSPAESVWTDSDVEGSLNVGTTKNLFYPETDLFILLWAYICRLQCRYPPALRF